MSSPVLPAGKLPNALLSDVLGQLPPPPAEVLLGPAVGEDASVLEVPAPVLVAASDPISLTADQVGRMAVTVNANDVAVTGVRPRWFLVTALLPLGTTEDDVRGLFADLISSLEEVGAVLVGGHTEITAAVVQPVVVGHMLGSTSLGGYVATGGAGLDETVVQVGPVPVEAAAVLAAEAGDRLGGVEPAVRQAALDALDDPGISVVEPALAAVELGATSLHDATEGGLAAGLHELAAASGLAVELDRSAVRWFGPGVAVCEALGADPWAALASGALLATFERGDAASAVAALAARGYVVSVIGRTREGSGVVDLDGEVLACPPRDEVARVLQ